MRRQTDANWFLGGGTAFLAGVAALAGSHWRGGELLFLLGLGLLILGSYVVVASLTGWWPAAGTPPSRRSKIENFGEWDDEGSRFGVDVENTGKFKSRDSDFK